MGKGIKLIRSLVNLVHLSHHLGLNKFGWERISLNIKFLKLNLLVSGTLIVAALDTWQETNPHLLFFKIIMVGLLLLEMEA